MKFDFDFLKGRYDAELKRKEQITTALTLPVSVLVVLGALMIAMAQSFSYMDGFLTCLFLIFLGLAAFAFLICVVYVGRTYYPRPYMYLPLLNKLQTSRELCKSNYLGLYKALISESGRRFIAARETIIPRVGRFISAGETIIPRVGRFIPARAGKEHH